MLHGCECPMNELDMLMSAKTIPIDRPAIEHKTDCLVFIYPKSFQNKTKPPTQLCVRFRPVTDGGHLGNRTRLQVLVTDGDT